jgi:TldD protein
MTPLKGPCWDELAELALNHVRHSGAEYGDIRIQRIETQTISGEDQRIANIQNSQDLGFGVRVLYDGAWGFAASSILSIEEIPRVAELAVQIAKGSASINQTRIQLTAEPMYQGTVKTPWKLNPFDVPLEDKTALLLSAMGLLHQHPGIVRSQASMWACRDRKLFVSMDGSHLSFDLMAVQGGFEATALLNGRFASRGFNTPHLRTGYELLARANFLQEVLRVAAQAREKVNAPSVQPGAYDLVLDPEHLALTIHESCGHPSELDRALGYEADYAGTSFLTPEKLGHFRYGSSQVNLIADNTEPETLAATGFDDDGVPCQRWEIVREGLFVGYCTNREVATTIGDIRSRGSNRAESWASIPMVRIANIGLAPGEATLDQLLSEIKRGIYIEGHGSYSIDQRRYNFQFGGDAFWLIENGKRTHMLRDVIYHGITPEFWHKCDGVADANHRGRFGFITCGKGQPGQTGWMTHPASHARFRTIQVIQGQAMP